MLMKATAHVTLVEVTERRAGEQESRRTAESREKKGDTEQYTTF